MLRGEEMWRLIGVVARCNCAAVPQSRPFSAIESRNDCGKSVASVARQLNVLLHLLAIDGINARQSNPIRPPQRR